MATSGWYPDPGGAPGQFRYWDGTNWSAATTTNPTPPKKPRNRGILIALAVALVLVVVVVFGIRSLIGRGESVLTDPNPPQPSVSGWDDSKPLPTATPTPTPTASETPEPSDAAPQGQVACADGDPGARQAHPNDGRRHGGALSFAPPNWSDGKSYSQTMSWAHDTDGVMETTEPGWAALLAVGALHAEDGFSNPKQAADGMMQCIASSAYYSTFSARKDISSEAVTIDGHKGWSIRSEIRVDEPALSVPGDVAEVIVVDTGQQGRLSFFFGCAPIGDQPRMTILDDVIADLRVD